MHQHHLWQYECQTNSFIKSQNYFNCQWYKKINLKLIFKSLIYWQRTVIMITPHNKYFYIYRYYPISKWSNYLILSELLLSIRYPFHSRGFQLHNPKIRTLVHSGIYDSTYIKEQHAIKFCLEVINRNIIYNSTMAKKKIRKWDSVMVYIDPDTPNFAIWLQEEKKNQNNHALGERGDCLEDTVSIAEQFSWNKC